MAGIRPTITIYLYIRITNMIFCCMSTVPARSPASILPQSHLSPKYNKKHTKLNLSPDFYFFLLQKNNPNNVRSLLRTRVAVNLKFTFISTLF